MSDENKAGAERSRATLAGHPEGDISHYIWPNYRRITAAQGGDVSATFSFSRDDVTLETWFYDRLTAEFKEVYKGQICFLGRIHTMRLAYNRTVLTLSLDWLFNHVACQYTSELDNSTLMTDFFSDTASQGLYGIRSQIIRPSDAIGLAEAEDLAQQYLADFAYPRVSRGAIESTLKKGVLQVTIQGYSQTLDAQFHNEPTEGEDDASVEVLATLAGASFITAGNVATNTAQVSITSDYRRKLQRIAGIAARRDAGGNAYTYGAVGSRLFDYQPVTEPSYGTGFRYDIFLKRPFIQYFQNKSYVPSPLVRPGGWSRIVDMRRPASSGLASADPLNQFDATVTYSKDGAVLAGAGWDEKERTEAIQMALINRRV
jgi:hypothetical protein